MTRSAPVALLVAVCALPAWSFTRDEVLLYVPFDGSLEPLVAAEGTAPIVDKAIDFEFGDGVVGRAVMTGGEGALIQYPTAGNMDPEEGTFSIWVQSIDWTLQDAPKINRWWIDVPGPTRFIIYHYLHSAGMYFYHMDVRRERPSIIKAPGPWEEGEWKHLCGTWKDGRLRFYVNAQKVPEELQVELGPLGEFIRLGDPNHHTGTEQRWDTQLDEFYVLSRALEDVEVRALYQRGMADARSALRVPPIPAPTLDGVLGDDEWSSAAGVTGFVNRVTGLIDHEQGTAWVGHDGENLYVAQRWPIPERVLQQPDNYSFGAFRAEATERDGEPLAADDVAGIEVMGPNGMRRIVANAAGAVGDADAGDPSWDCGATAAGTVDGEAWVCELAIPLADLGLAPGDVTELRLVRAHRLLRTDEVAWPHSDYAAEGALATQPGAVQLTSIGRPWLGELDLRLTAVGRSTDAELTTGGEVAEEHALAAGEQWRLERTLTDTSVTGLHLSAWVNDGALLATTTPFTYPPMLEVTHFLYPSKDLLEVIVSTRGAASAAPARVEVRAAGETEVVQSLGLRANRGDERVAPVDIGGLEPGRYIATVTVGGAEKALGAGRFGFEVRERPEWLGNSVGIIDYVPEPWTPMQYDGTRVSVWGRTVELGDSLLPAQIVSQGESLLAGPVALVGSAANAEVRPADATLEFGEQTEQRATWRTRAALGPVQAEVDAWMEYDGFMWFELTLSAEQAATLDGLRLEVPFAKEHSTLLYSGNYRTIDTGYTPSEPWATGPVPCLGLSDEERGMQWCMQSRRGWSLEKTDSAIQVVPRDDANVLVVTFMDQPTEIAEPRTIAFGLHPAPIKPPLEGRRMLRAVGKGLQAANISLWQTHWCLGCSYPLPVSESGHRVVKERHGYGWRTMLYTRLAECSVKGPWYQYFRDEWRIDPGPRMDFDAEADWGKANPVCQNSRSWQDWTVWSFREAMQELDADGIYYDVSRPALCMNRHHGCGFINERGELEPEYQILAARELQKRMWVLMHEQLDRECVVTHHMSGHLWTPTQSFSDAIIDGENYTSMLKDNYYELLSLDKFRAEFMGHQWGLTSIFLPEFSRAQLTPEGKELYESPEKLPQVRHLAGMILLHDSLPWPSYSDLTPYNTIWAAQDELGWGDEVDFFPYWANAEVLDPMGELLVASIFRNEGRLLIVLFNNTDEEQQAPLKLDLGALGVDATALRDFETGETFALTEGATTVPITGRNFRLLLSE